MIGVSVQAHDFRHLAHTAASLQPDEDRLCQQFGDALVTVCPRHRDLLDASVPMLHTRNICLDDDFKLAVVQLLPSPLGQVIQGCRLLGLGMPHLVVRSTSAVVTTRLASIPSSYVFGSIKKLRWPLESVESWLSSFCIQ